MFRIIEAEPLPNFRVHLRFHDGTEGVADLAHLAGQGVFACWSDPVEFVKVEIGENGQLRWPGDIDLCPDSLYLEVTGNTPEAVFPNLQADAHA